MKPPRACFLDYPLGSCLGVPNDPAHQRASLRAVLESLPRFTRPGQIIDLPLRWPVPGWEKDVERAYREEPDVLVAQRRRNEFDAAGHHVTKAAAEEAAGYCKDCAV